MKTYDWLVVGGGMAGAALGYELTSQGFSVLILEQYPTLQGATRYSYGGLAYWSGTSELTRVLCQEGKERHRILSEELDSTTEFRELDLVLTIAADCNPENVAASYANFASPPKLLTVKEGCELEPLLNPDAIAGVLTVPHGHIHPEKTTEAYLQAFRRKGGELAITQVIELVRENHSIKGVKTTHQPYYAANTVISTGGISRTLLKASGINVRLYFTHAEMIEIPTANLKLRTLVMPANTQRFTLEAKASTAEVDPLWDEPGHEPVPSILDAGAVQFLDGRLRIGQISRILTDPYAQIDPVKSEAAIRTQVGSILPALETLPGTWYHCLVAFGHNRLPVVGILGEVDGIYIFSGFTNPLVFIPPLAKRFANWVGGEDDEIINQLSLLCHSPYT